MKNIIIVTIWMLFNFCNAQRIKTENNDMKYYSENQYKNWEYDPEWCWPQEPCSRENSHFYLMKGNERIRVWRDDEIIKVERSSVINPYTFHKSFSSKNNILLSEWIEFYRAFTGIDRQYNENGKLILQEDQDKSYPFSIVDLIKKFKREYNVDIENRKNVRNVYRGEKMREVGIPIYQVILKTEVENKWVEYLVDANTGKTLYIMKSSEGDETNLVEEYLKSIRKFKGTPSKLTSQKSNPLSNEELGRSYAYRQALP